MISAKEGLGVTVSTVSDAKLLEDIVEYIDTHGHHKESLIDKKTGAICIQGAALFVTNQVDENGWIRGLIFLQSDLHRILETNVVGLNDDNDWPCIRDTLLNKAKDIRNNVKR